MQRFFYILLAAALISGCGMIGGKKESIPSERDLRSEYKTSKDSFKSKYDGKDVSVWGKADKVDLTGSLGIIRFSEATDSDLSGTPSVSCEIDPADFAKFNDQKVTTGTFLRVKGKMAVSDVGLDLKNCKLEKQGLDAVGDD
jgi:hypothetical protein